MASVYIFNLNQQPIDMLMINNRPAKSVPLAGWDMKTYQPSGIAVPRSPLPSADNSDAAFSQQDLNEVYVHWQSGNQTSQFKIDMHSLDPAMNEDYLLYIAPEQWILFDQFGTMVAPVPAEALPRS